jgi:hypothetical protein
MAFLTSYLAEGVLFEIDISQKYNQADLSDIFSKEVEYLAALCAFNSEFKKYLASDIACAIIIEARTTMEISPVWNEKLDVLIRENPLSSEQVQQILSLLENFKLGPKPEAVFEIVNTPTKDTKLQKPNSMDDFEIENGNPDKENMNVIARTSPVSVRELSF